MCPRVNEQKFTFNPGVFLVTLREPCSIVGKGWRITGIITKQFNTTIENDNFELPLAINLSAVVKQESVLRVFQNQLNTKINDIEPLSAVETVHFKPLKFVERSSDQSIIHPVSLYGTSGLFLISVVVLIVIFVVFRRSHVCRSKQPTVMVEQLPLSRFNVNRVQHTQTDQTPSSE